MPLPDLAATVPALRTRVAAWRDAGERVALVPTMGALHDGHLALVRRAREVADRAVVSIFVNPKQFAASEDFGSYPRVAERDRVRLDGLADLVYAPGLQDMYPPGFATTVSVAGPSAGLEGSARPTHFDGVATVVTKLLLQAGADHAIFGEKDWQQLQVVRRLVADLDIPTAIVGHPTVRDGHGLALSSRNAYLSEAEFAVARRLNVLLGEIAGSLARDPWSTALAAGARSLLAAGFAGVDYLSAVDAETLAPLAAFAPGRTVRLLAAARIGSVRLLDNLAVESP